MTDAPGIYPMRLQRFLARAGVASRRGSERLMTEGRVRVNGDVVTELGSKVDPLHDVVSVDGRVYALGNSHCYLVLNKPAGCLTTMSDPFGRPTVADIVPAHDHPGLFPVGRLDADTSGCLLFTTDGMMGQNLLHPSRHVDKTYIACISGRLDADDVARLEQGVRLDDGEASPASVEVLGAHDPRSALVRPEGLGEREQIVALTIHEGRKHQVKRMFLAVGHLVKTLHRLSFGPLDAHGLAAGEWRHCTEAEVATLREAAGIDTDTDADAASGEE